MQDVGKKEASDILKIVRMIMARQFDPVRPRRCADHTTMCVGRFLGWHLKSATCTQKGFLAGHVWLSSIPSKCM